MFPVQSANSVSGICVISTFSHSSFNYTHTRDIHNVSHVMCIAHTFVIDFILRVMFPMQLQSVTAVHQDSLALLISIYNGASISTCRNHLIYCHTLWRVKLYDYIISLFSIGLTNAKIIPVL